MAGMQTEVGIDFLQGQIDHCDTIVANIDKIVPKLYKIRQQSLAQKEYINDVNKTILTNIHTTAPDGNKSITLDNSVDFSSDTTVSSAVTANSEDSRKIIQSLFKFKHEMGTTKHFTTEQQGVTAERTTGFNLSDVVNITTGLDNLLTLNSTTGNTITNANVSKLFQKPAAAVVPVVGTVLIAGSRSGNAYAHTTGTVTSGFTATTTASDTILGFGLT
jgi:hypothetical protein